MVPKLRPAEMVKPMLRDLMSLGNTSPISKWKTGKTPTEYADTVQITNISGRNPSDSRNEFSSECVFKYEKVAWDMSDKMLTETQLTKRALLETLRIAKLDSVADKTWKMNIKSGNHVLGKYSQNLCKFPSKGGNENNRGFQPLARVPQVANIKLYKTYWIKDWNLLKLNQVLRWEFFNMTDFFLNIRDKVTISCVSKIWY